MSDQVTKNALRPIITKKGLEAALSASTLGIEAKITHVGLTERPGEGSDEMEALPGESLRLKAEDGTKVNPHQVSISVLLREENPGMNIHGIGFFLEDGTLFAVYQTPTPILNHTAGTQMLVSMDVVMGNIPGDSITVEATGANLDLGGFVKITRKVNGKELRDDVTLSAADVGALSTALGGTVMKAIKLGGDSQYLTQANSDVYLVAKAGKVILEGEGDPIARIGGKDYELIHSGNLPSVDLSGYVKSSRKINNKPLTTDITLSSDDVDAVGKTGAQTMRGQLNGVKFTVTDAYALVSRLRAQHGLYLGNNANDKRTILGGGGDEVGDASGSIILRPNGITDPAGATTFNPDGTITNGAEPAAGSHLTNKTYVDKVVKVVNDLFGNYLPLIGGTMKGAILAHAIKSAIKVNNGASVSFQDGAGTMFHLFGEGNAFRLRHGNNGESGIVSFYADQVDVHRTLYARTGLITQNSAGSRWLAMETPESGNPYISARASGEANPVQVLEFQQTRIRTKKLLHADSMQVQANGGLRFAPTDDWSGVTWGMGIDAENRNLGIHKYVNGVWSGAPFQITPANALLVDGLVVNGGSESQYHQIRNNGNPSLEIHQPGNSAVMMYKPQNKSVVRFCQSNGAGGETLGYGEVSQYGFETVNGRFTATYQSANRPWGGWGQNAFHMNEVKVGEGSLVGIVGAHTHFPGKWQLEFGYGSYTVAEPLLCGHVLNCIDSGGTFHRRWILRNDGYLEPAGGGWHISPNGDLYSSRLAGTNVVDWTIAGFSQLGHKHDARDGNWSAVQGRHSEVGTYMFACLNPHSGHGANMNPGSQVPGSALHPAGASQYSENRGWAFSGTWMCMGSIKAGNTDDNWDDYTTLWFRVA